MSAQEPPEDPAEAERAAQEARRALWTPEADHPEAAELWEPPPRLSPHVAESSTQCP